MPSKAGNIASEVQSFTVLPLCFPALPAFPKETTHYLYLRANAPRIPTEDTPRELFLVNAPVDSTEVHIRSLFADQLGGARVESVEFENQRVGSGIKAPIVHQGKKGKKRKRNAEDASAAEHAREEVGLLPETWDRDLHRSGGTAVVRFVDRASAEMGLREVKRAVKHDRKITWGAGVESKVPPLGYARYLTHHKLRYPDHEVLQSSVDAFMSAFSAQEGEQARKLALQRSEPDEDGFVTVTRGGRTGGPAREEETKAKEEELKKREKNRVKDDFYRFQVREKKKEQAKDLARGFEEDAKRMQEIRRRKGRIRPE